MNIRDLEQKAKAGSAAAQCDLGICYLDGIDVDVDYNEAFRLLSAAAAQGASRAVLNLARMHAKGLGMPVDVQEAIRHYEAVGRVEILAAIELGRIYSQGLGVTRDSEKAANWYRVAATLGDAGSDEIREALHYSDKTK